MTKDELQAQVEHLKLRAQAERLLKIAAPAQAHNNPFTGSGDEYTRKRSELDALNEREEAAAFHAAYLSYGHAQAYHGAGLIDDGALDELEAKYPVLADLRHRGAK